MPERDILPGEQPAVEPQLSPESPHSEPASVPKNLVRAFVVCVIVAIALLVGQFYVAIFRQPVFKLADATPELDPNAELKAKDTDQDGISDYDETNLYFTSPYLADSDSDGILDREELMKGSDPNCPTGKPCANFEPTSTVKAEDIGPPEPAPISTTTNGVDVTNLTPVQLRDILRTNGMTEAEIAQLSDEQLMTIYLNALGTTQENATPSPAPTGTGVSANPTPAEIRALLIKNGADKAQIDAMSDAELVKLYQDTLKQFQGSNP